MPSVDFFISARTFDIPNSFKSCVTFERLLLINSILSNVLLILSFFSFNVFSIIESDLSIYFIAYVKTSIDYFIFS
jgi:hypothetical protein